MRKCDRIYLRINKFRDPTIYNELNRLWVPLKGGSYIEIYKFMDRMELFV